ncbi:DUF418 domain-containing protein [Alteromonadaceae bacterium M269]|nr:DUF418 domain-containing protein [Alteromonadaceae bacterium M269]
MLLNYEAIEPAINTPYYSAAQSHIPLTSSQRISELDVLRGIALFGVLLGNFSEYIMSGFIATSEQLAALTSAGHDKRLQFFIELFVTDKANTLFSFLFGVSFSMQIQRLSKMGEGASMLYLRRLVILLAFGFLHLFFVSPWDILHMYAALGLILFLFRESSDRTLLYSAIFFLLFGTLIYRTITSHFNIHAALENYRFYTDSAILLRQSLSSEGNYWGLVTNLANYTWRDWLLGSSGGSAFYLIGRFFFGAWVGRKGWFNDTSSHLKVYALVCALTLPLGLSLELIVLKTNWFVEGHRVMHTIATLALSASYVCLVILLFHWSLLRRFMQIFSYVGRMALTNYVLQSLIIGFTYWGFLGGANLAGRIGLSGVLFVAVTGYLGLILLSRVWLSYFAYGPLEWGWRCLTYWQVLSIKRQHR